MTTYQKKKEAARATAISWQNAFLETAQSYQEIATQSAYFEKVARRFGLLKEFKENGLI